MGTPWRASFWIAAPISNAARNCVANLTESRRAAVEQLIQAAGGTVESYYFVFGDQDVIVVVDLPDNATVAAVSLAMSASGGVSTAVRVLLSPEEIDAAVTKTVEYRAPGR